MKVAWGIGDGGLGVHRRSKIQNPKSKFPNSITMKVAWGIADSGLGVHRRSKIQNPKSKISRKELSWLRRI
jgi:hypothetical protein